MKLFGLVTLGGYPGSHYFNRLGSSICLYVHLERIRYSERGAKLLEHFLDSDCVHRIIDTFGRYLSAEVVW